MVTEAYEEADLSDKTRQDLRANNALVAMVEQKYSNRRSKGDIQSEDMFFNPRVRNAVAYLNEQNFCHPELHIDPERYTTDGRAREIRSMNKPCYWLTAVFPFTHSIGAVCAFASGNPDNYVGGAVLATIALAAFPVMRYALRIINSDSMDLYLRRLRAAVENTNARLSGINPVTE